MGNNILKPACQNKAGRVLFYIFEIAALAIGALFVVLGLVDAIQASAFMLFVNGIMQGAIYMLILYALGKIIDLLYCKNEKQD